MEGVKIWFLNDPRLMFLVKGELRCHVNWRERSAIHHRDPCIKGRVPANVIVGSIADGDTARQILDASPQPLAATLGPL